MIVRRQAAGGHKAWRRILRALCFSVSGFSPIGQEPGDRSQISQDGQKPDRRTEARSARRARSQIAVFTRAHLDCAFSRSAPGGRICPGAPRLSVCRGAPWTERLSLRTVARRAIRPNRPTCWTVCSTCTRSTLDRVSPWCSSCRADSPFRRVCSVSESSEISASLPRSTSTVAHAQPSASCRRIEIPRQNTRLGRTNPLRKRTSEA